MKPTIAQIIELKKEIVRDLEWMRNSKRECDSFIEDGENGPCVPESLKGGYYYAAVRLYERDSKKYFDDRADFDAMVYRFTSGTLHEKKDMAKLLDMEDGTLEALLEAMEGRH